MTTDPIVIKPDQTVGEALVVMFERDIRHLPVVEEGELVGIISDRDIQQFLGKARLPGKDRRKEDRSLQFPVREIMSRHPITVAPKMSIREGVKIMTQHKVGALPVVDYDEKVIGIFTEVDALEYCLHLIDRYEGPERL